MPIAVKDLCETEGVPTGAGSHVMDGFVSTRDAEVVHHLREAGAVLIGKTVTHEFAYGQNMPETRNAWDQSCYPGGSSAGSGVAVAAGTAYGAVGTDTGGSIRVPASVNGVVGLKPTFDRVSRVGVFPMSPTLDTVGPIMRSVEDAALILDVIAGGGTADPNTGDPVRGYVAKPWLDLRDARTPKSRTCPGATSWSAASSATGVTAAKNTAPSKPPPSRWSLPSRTPPRPSASPAGSGP